MNPHWSAAPPPDGRRALDETARRGLARYLRHAVLTIVAGFLVLGATGIVARAVDARADRLQRDGIRVPGVVAWPHGDGSWVRFEYRWHGEQRFAVVRTSSVYPYDQPLVVLVDPNDSSNVTLLGERNESPSTSRHLIEAFVLGAAILVLGLCTLGRERRQRRFLSERSWGLRPIRVVLTSKLSRPKYEIGVGPNLWQAVDVSTTTPWRLAWSGIRSASSVEVVTTGDKCVLLRAPGSEIVLSAEARGGVIVDAPAAIVSPEDGRARAADQLRTGRRLRLFADAALAAGAFLVGLPWLGFLFLAFAIGYALSVRVLVRKGPDGWYGAPAFAR